ncbi:hypothetical protein [Cellulosimicrobium cellulans]|nr:hypothetical protein [Cellulosimicrobium cellulans]
MQIKARIAAVAVAAVAVAGLVTPAQAAEGSTTDQRDQLIAFLT